MEWNGLAGLMNIPYSEREEIRKKQAKYPDSFSKAEKSFLFFNDSKDFCRGALEKWVEELNLHDVKNEMLNIDEVYLCYLSRTTVMITIRLFCIKRNSRHTFFN